MGNNDDLLAASLTQDLEWLWRLTSCRSQVKLRVKETLNVIEAAANNEGTPARTPLLVLLQHDPGRLLHQRAKDFVSDAGRDIRLSTWAEKIQRMIKEVVEDMASLALRQKLAAMVGHYQGNQRYGSTHPLREEKGKSWALSSPTHS